MSRASKQQELTESGVWTRLASGSRRVAGGGVKEIPPTREGQADIRRRRRGREGEGDDLITE